MSHDAIIIGAGPSGLIAAHRIAKQGYDVLVLEEHESVGKPDHCAGLLSSTGLERLGLRLPHEVVQNNVTGARIYSPSGYALRIERGKREAYVVNRRLFDSWLARRAIDSGAKLDVKSKFINVSRTDEGVYNFRTSDRPSEVRSTKAIINAEGSRCQISDQVGLPRVPRSSKLPAYQYEVSNVDLEEDLVEMFYGRNISSGFFAWIIPLGDRRARVGLASKDRSKQRLANIMKHHPIVKKRLDRANIDRGFGGVVLVGMPIRKTVNNGFLIVGDAAGIVKATTGGGVIFGGISANAAGHVISSALIDDNTPIQLGSYENKWRSYLMKELRLMYLAQKAITMISDRGLDILIKEAEERSLVDIIRKEGDMDMQSSVISAILTNPRMVTLGIRILRFLNPFL
ncbi:MAG: geranylgeranyl reductase family protein [Candidatus Thorarchaeota archaeon]